MRGRRSLCALLVLAAAGRAAAQICNSDDEAGGGLFIPAFGTGGTRACRKDKADPLDLLYENYTQAECSGQGLCGQCQPAESDPQFFMSLVYLVLLLWCFLGVGIIADIFMEAISVITSMASVKKLHQKDGSERTVETLVWNATVANLTLMALGSSAPEILLNVIEIFDKQFYAGELGPSTIVGSAAFNLLVILAVCVTALPNGDTRVIEDQFVFGMTAISSVFAYLWLLVILQIWTPNVVTLAEATLTFAFFPVLVILAWLADTGKLQRLLGIAHTHGEGGGSKHVAISVNSASGERSFDKQEIARLVKGSFKTANGTDGNELEELAAAVQIDLTGGCNKARRRANASKGLYGGKQAKGMSVNLGAAKAKLEVQAQKKKAETVHWSSAHFCCKESDKKAVLHVERPPATTACQLQVDYSTSDGTAHEGADYIAQSGTLTFAPGELTQELVIVVLEDAEAEENEHFFVMLGEVKCEVDVQTAQDPVAKVTVIDTTGEPVIGFSETLTLDTKNGVPLYTVSEECGSVFIKVHRKGGADTEVKCLFETKSESASPGNDYEATYESNPTPLVFDAHELQKVVEIKIIDDELYEKDELFHVLLKDPQGATIDTHMCKVQITNDDAVKKTTDLLVKHLQINWDAMDDGGSAYVKQFRDALEWPEGGGAVVMHVLTVPWKLVFAFVPPPSMMGGWLCFCLALGMIGLVTALIGDLASHMGCAFGLKASVTAITFVALGTSLPDTFASKSAAIGDSNADSAVGNVTGSNSVNVFLGLGLPWLIAAVQWKIEGATPVWRARVLAMDFVGNADIVANNPGGAFVVPAGTLGFSVTIFSLCAVMCLVVICVRRARLGYELGGDKASPTAAVFVLLWVYYVSMSTLQAYDAFSKSGLNWAWYTLFGGGGAVMLLALVLMLSLKRPMIVHPVSP